MAEGDTLTLARLRPARFDVSAQTRLPAGPRRNRLSVAQQIRQDLWRCLQGVRGFSPVVAVTHADGGMLVRAGGRLACGGVSIGPITARIEALLAEEALRARWVRHA
jgi:hypothetical protein